MSEAPLWQLALDHIASRVQDLSPPSIRARIPGWMMELYSVGERPQATEVRTYLRQHHPGWQPTRTVIDTWTRLLEDPMCRSRLPKECRKYGFRAWPYDLTSDLIIDHKLRDTRESRVERFVLSAAKAFVEAAVEADEERWRWAAAELAAAQRATVWLRRELHGDPRLEE